MKKLYTTSSYKYHHQIKSLRSVRQNRKRKYKFYKGLYIPAFYEKFTGKQFRDSSDTRKVKVPVDFRLLVNTEECLDFFRELRDISKASYFHNKKIVFLTLKYVEEIDYAAISVLTSIADDLKNNDITLNGDFPDNEKCKKYIIDSGFLNEMVDENNKKFPQHNHSNFIVFKKGGEVLSRQERTAISLLVKNAVQHLIPDSDVNLKPVTSGILEICGNSLEHADKQWLLGVKYESDKVTFTVTDIGKGILETLNIKFTKNFWESIGIKSRLEMLMGAFEKKYGSQTGEINRNKGLPAVKANFDDGRIKNLIVLTNNVLLQYNNNTQSRVLNRGTARFKGTLYQWEVTSDCIINNINVNNGIN